MKKIIASVTTLLVLLLAFGLKPKVVTAAKNSQLIPVILHHRLAINDIPASVANTSRAREKVDDFLPGANTTFNLYDVTKTYNHRYQDKTIQQFSKWLENKQSGKALLASDRAPIAIFKTDASGNKKLWLEKHHVYWLRQVQPNISTDGGLSLEIASPVVFSLPVVDPVSGQEMNPVHLYTKAVQLQRQPYFFKYAKNNQGRTKPLAGAKFVLYREFAGHKEYLGTAGVWLATSSPLSQPKVLKLVSQPDGLVLLDNYNLKLGNYYFEEVQAPPGYEITASARKIKLEIPVWLIGNQVHRLKLNGVALPLLVGGKPSPLARSNLKLRVYNLAIERTGYPPSSPGSHRPHRLPPKPRYHRTHKWQTGLLPQTGEQVGFISLVGILIVLIAGYIEYRNRKRR